jgi:hypothetical protein
MLGTLPHLSAPLIARFPTALRALFARKAARLAMLMGARLAFRATQ